MTNADRLAIGLHLSMMLMEARRLPTREARVAYMTGQRFSGPHHYVTGDVVEVSRKSAEYAADLIEAEEKASADVSPTEAA